MFAPNELVDLTKVEIITQGVWLQQTANALDVSIAAMARKIKLTSPQRLHQHIKDRSYLGTPHLAAIKAAYPQVNLNYVLFGELPILLPKADGNSDIDVLRQRLAWVQTELERVGQELNKPL